MIVFGQKVKGCAPTFLPQIENNLWRKCTSDITAWRAVLYRVTKKFEKFYEKVDTLWDCRERVQIRRRQIRRHTKVWQSLLSPKAESCRARDSSFFFSIPDLKLFFYTDQLFSAVCAFIDSLKGLKKSLFILLCKRLSSREHLRIFQAHKGLARLRCWSFRRQDRPFRTDAVTRPDTP